MSTPSLYFLTNKKLLKALFKIRSVYPAKALSIIAKIPGIGSPQLQKDAGMLIDVYKKLDDMYEVFSHFTLNEWIYESKMVVELDAAMSPEER